MRRKLVCAIVVFSLARPEMLCAQDDKAVRESGQSEEASAEQFGLRAHEIVGLARLPKGATLSGQATTELIVGSDKTSPFLAHKIDGQHVWRVRYESVLLQFEKWPDGPYSSREYDIEVFFDSATGQLLKITLLNDQHDTSLVKKPTAESAAKQLDVVERITRTQPDGDPPTTLMQVLASLSQCPLLATEIVAYYWSMNLVEYGGEFRPTWEVYLYGHPSFRFKPYPELPLSDRNYVRYVIDATTGRWIFSSNTPIPSWRDPDTVSESGGGVESTVMPLSSDEILARAIKVLGESKLEDWKTGLAETSLEVVTITDNETPFLSGQLNGRTASRVTFSDVPVRLDKFTGKDTVVYTGVRDFEVYLDPTTGQLLKIVSTLESYQDKVASGEIRKPSVEEAEEQLGRASESYLGFSPCAPMLGFLDVLKAAASNPLRADQINAYLVEYSRGSSYEAAIWIIETYGVESATLGHYPFQVYQLNHIRTIVDTTGNPIFSTNSPYATE